MTEIRLDFNEAATGPADGAVARILAHTRELHLYPRGLHEEAEASVARLFGVQPEEVIVTNGVDEATDLVLLHAQQASCFVPGFNGYWHRAAALSIPMRRMPLDDAWQPRHEPGPQRGALLVAQPNNPTGSRFTGEWLAVAAAAYDLVLVDETYLAFAERPAESAQAAGLANVCIFVSFSKAYGLAGLRLGALVGPADLISHLRQRKSFYSVDSLALHGLLGAVSDPNVVERAVSYVRKMRPLYIDTLRSAGHLVSEVRETEANFVIFRPAAGWSTGNVRRALAARGIEVTDCANFGLDEWLRVTVGSELSLQALSNAVASLELAA
jgi:histidinol-phosphate aminotransferase